MPSAWPKRSPPSSICSTPDVIVLGGGLSEIAALYRLVPAAWGAHASVTRPATRLVRARFGPESGLRGAARLTPRAISEVAES